MPGQTGLRTASLPRPGTTYSDRRWLEAASTTSESTSSGLDGSSELPSTSCLHGAVHRRGEPLLLSRARCGCHVRRDVVRQGGRREGARSLGRPRSDGGSRWSGQPPRRRWSSPVGVARRSGWRSGCRSPIDARLHPRSRSRPDLRPVADPAPDSSPRPTRARRGGRRSLDVKRLIDVWLAADGPDRPVAAAASRRHRDSGDHGLARVLSPGPTRLAGSSIHDRQVPFDGPRVRSERAAGDRSTNG